jgi:23S rRNA (cytidine1920-2'-O)/16S rRNA (cytidine1409-2'-O)-methyltransferase
MAGPRKERIDRLLVGRDLAPTRERAQALILAGQVFVEGCRIDKAGSRVADDARVEVRGRLPFVGRGGVKLAGALDALGVEVKDAVALDAGASTGGFTDCLLQRGARRVYAVDVGYGQLDEKIRRDPRVVVMERTNLRHLAPDALPEKPSLVTLDLSFISLRTVLPALRPLLAPAARILALVKPQFEVGRRRVGKGGVIRDPALHAEAVKAVVAAARAAGLAHRGSVPSPLPGESGNREFFTLFETGPAPAPAAEGDGACGEEDNLQGDHRPLRPSS